MINLPPTIPAPSNPSTLPSSPDRKTQRPLSQSLFPIANLDNTSNLSLHSNPGARGPLLRSREQRAPDQAQPLPTPLGRSSQQRRQQSQSQSEGARTDALWAEMQATLAEVELSAARGTHFFGPEHSAALEELRKAQIALAQAWARSEADEIVD